MEYSAEERALIWLCGCTDTDARERLLLLRAAGSASALMEGYGAYLGALRPKEAYRDGGPAERQRELEALLADMEEKGQFAVTSIGEDYPEALKAADPPLVLFCKGRRELLGGEKFCIVGSRITPAWAERTGTEIARELSKRLVIVTGMAEGGDLAAIRGALEGGNLLCVLPCGIDECYPAAHAAYKEEIGRKGLVVSECPPHEKVRKYSFYARNRILAGLSKGVLLLSAGEKSGALITAGYAADYGRDVFALPYSVGSAQGVGCNELIKRGAFLCTGAEDILSAYGIETEKKETPALTGEEARVYEILRMGEELHVAVIAERTGIPVYRTAAVLSALELKGLAVKAGGNRYGSVK